MKQGKGTSSIGRGPIEQEFLSGGTFRTAMLTRTRLLMEGSEAKLLIVRLGCHRNDRGKKPSDGGTLCRSGVSCFMPFVFLLVWPSFSLCCQRFSAQSQKRSKEKNENVRLAVDTTCIHKSATRQVPNRVPGDGETLLGFVEQETIES